MILIKPSLFLRAVRAIPSSDIDTPNFLRKRRRTLPFQLMPQPEPPIYVNSNRLRGKCISILCLRVLLTAKFCVTLKYYSHIKLFGSGKFLYYVT